MTDPYEPLVTLVPETLADMVEDVLLGEDGLFAVAPPEVWRSVRQRVDARRT